MENIFWQFSKKLHSKFLLLVAVHLHRARQQVHLHHQGLCCDLHPALWPSLRPQGHFAQPLQRWPHSGLQPWCTEVAGELTLWQHCSCSCSFLFLLMFLFWYLLELALLLLFVLFLLLVLLLFFIALLLFFLFSSPSSSPLLSLFPYSSFSSFSSSTHSSSSTLLF